MLPGWLLVLLDRVGTGRVRVVLHVGKLVEGCGLVVFDLVLPGWLLLLERVVV